MGFLVVNFPGPRHLAENSWMFHFMENPSPKNGIIPAKDPKQCGGVAG